MFGEYVGVGGVFFCLWGRENLLEEVVFEFKDAEEGWGVV